MYSTPLIVDDLITSEPRKDVDAQIESGLVISGDETLIRILLQNLLENAWKFTRTTLNPKIELLKVEDEGELAICIRDNGVGFDMGFADKLFAPFHRLHTNDEIEGVGIGLATVQRIVQRHGGRVWAESKPGEGASFYFTCSFL